MIIIITIIMIIIITIIMIIIMIIITIMIIIIMIIIIIIIHAADTWYNHNPETVISSGQVTLIWDMQIHTDKEIKANKPDIVTKNHANNTCQLIDITIPSDRNVSIKEVEKFSKYKDLKTEISKCGK